MSIDSVNSACFPEHPTNEVSPSSLRCRQPNPVRGRGYVRTMQAGQMCIIQAHTPLDTYVTQPFRDSCQATDNQPFPDQDARRLGICDHIVTKHGLAIKGSKLPNQYPDRPAKYEMCDSIYDSPEDEDRDL